MKQLAVPSGISAFLNGKKVFCGFSGGPDSLALLCLLHEEAGKIPFELKAVHFEHGLRGRAGVEDADFCRDFCKKRGIPFECISLKVPEHRLEGESIETAARRLRMEYWNSLPKGSVVALGHQSDDIVENLLLRLIRGSNVSGLTSLSETTVMKGITYLRPLAGFSREEIIHWLQGRGLQWRTDATNFESDYGRNFIRNRILPELYRKFPYAGGGLIRSHKNLSEDAEFIDNEANKQFLSMDSGSREEWLSLPKAILCRVFRLFLERETGHRIIAGHELTDRFEKMLSAPPEKGFSELKITGFDQYSVFVGKTSVFLADSNVPEPVRWNYRENSELCWGKYVFRTVFEFKGQGNGAENAVFDRAGFPDIILIRSVLPEDTMVPFGRKSRASVRKLLSDAGVPAPLRASYPVFCASDGSILWIPGVRRSDKHPARDFSETAAFSFAEI